MGQEWETKYLEDIEYLKSDELMYGRLFDKMGIHDQKKRNWLDKYVKMHQLHEQNSQIMNNSLYSEWDTTQLLPKSIRIHAQTYPLNKVEKK